MSSQIFQNEPKNFIKLLHQPTKTHDLVGQFPSIQKGNKEAYDSIDALLCRLKEYIGKHIVTRYVRDITDMITRNDDDKKVFLLHQNLKHQYYA